MKKGINIILICAALAFMVIGYFWLSLNPKPHNLLPYYGPKTVNAAGDSSYHTVGDFGFINQYGEPVTQASLDNKIYVVDYFFTTCHSICPRMTSQLTKVYDAFHKTDQVIILSHTVNPEEDSVAVLKQYAEQYGVKDHKWLFVTGNKQDLYSLARRSYFLDAHEGNGGEDDFIHTQNFALIDKHRHIRGYYDGTDSTDVAKLIMDMKLLLQED